MSTDFFQQVREDVRDSVRAPDLDAIHRAGKRRRRTRGVAAVAGVAALIVIVGTIAIPQHKPTPPASAEKHGPIAGTPIQLTASMTVSQLQPMTKTLTYAVVQTEPGVYAIARTTDAGRHWSAWSLPTSAQNALVREFVTKDILFLNGDIASDNDLPNVLNDQTIMLGGYLSRDGGQSWKPITDGVKNVRDHYPPTYIGNDINQLPAGWRVAFHQLDSELAVGAIDPDTGVWHHLTNTPDKFVRSVNLGTDGSLWGTFSDKPATLSEQTGSTHPAITYAVSHDRGRSWTSYLLPAEVAAQASDAPISTDGVHAYATLSKNVPGSGEVVSAGAMVTDNGGKTWTKQSSAPALPFGGIPLPDGGIIGLPMIGSNCFHEGANGLVVTRDGGQTCSMVPQVRDFGRFGRNANGLLILTDRTQYPTNFRISSDGLNWTPVTGPPVGK